MQRLHWIDNLRILVIILVVILHAAVTYSGIGGWYFKENGQVDTASTLFFGGPLYGVMLIAGGWNWPAFFYALWESFICVTFIIAMVGLFRHKVDRGGRIQQILLVSVLAVAASFFVAWLVRRFGVLRRVFS